ncbi:MAG: glycolate oxidase subunit GlcF [Rhodocyclaceae bacterium]|nr:glycolate oxidase subunit GlcF [Rhodocyclaceae bacterium]
MQTRLPDSLLATLEGATADAVLRKCVHCGFCLATCPTYQILGDELDSPRGRIYLIKNALESGAASATTLQHLDRCLGCRSCETTCPSGVSYHRLLDIGRRAVQARVARPWRVRLMRTLLRRGLLSPLFGPLLRLGRLLRPLLPAGLRDKVPGGPETVACSPSSQAGPRPVAPLTSPAQAAAPASGHTVILPRGCVQPHLRPAIDMATEAVLAALGDRVLRPAAGACCGAIPAHLDDAQAARALARANIDAWWPLLESGAARAIISNASGCGLTLQDYPDWFADDPVYAPRARRVAEAAMDIGQWLAQRREAWPARWTAAPRRRVAWHPPCTLQHGLAAAPAIEATLRELGFDLQRPADAHLCCGSAGAWSVLNPGLADELRGRKLGHLDALPGDVIVTANIGCQQHLAARSSRPVLHWVECLAGR